MLVPFAGARRRNPGTSFVSTSFICRCAGYTREVLFLTDGGVSGNEEERILSLVGGSGTRSTVSPAPKCPHVLQC